VMKKERPFKLEVVSVRLSKELPICAGSPVSNPQEAVRLVGRELCEMDREVICVINLKADGTPINCSFVSMGALNEALAHPREMVKASILSNAANMIMVHNHPSGQLLPSSTDTWLTDRMVQVCQMIGIPLLDHIIVGGDNTSYFSFKEKDILPMASIRLKTDYQEIQMPEMKIAEEGRSR